MDNNLTRKCQEGWIGKNLHIDAEGLFCDYIESVRRALGLHHTRCTRIMCILEKWVEEFYFKKEVGIFYVISNCWWRRNRMLPINIPI